MALALTPIVSIFIIERIDEKKGTMSIIPLVMAGIISVVYWRQVYYFISFFCTRIFVYPMMVLVDLLISKELDLYFFSMFSLEIKLIVNFVKLRVN